MKDVGHDAVIRGSRKPTGKRRNFYCFAKCKLCGATCGATSGTSLTSWTFSAIYACQPPSETVAVQAPAPMPSVLNVTCFTCLDSEADRSTAAACPLGHHVCCECMNANLADFDFAQLGAVFRSLKLVLPEFNLQVLFLSH